MPGPVTYELNNDIAVITIDNPPVNAASLPVRRGLMQAFALARDDARARAVVLACGGRTFVAGADIAEFDQPTQDPWLPAVVDFIEASAKPVVAAIHGTALGGGFELAMACHYRIALESARLGLPEVTLGLLPGAQGTQRLPRLVGVHAALEIMIGGRPMSAPDAHGKGAVDRVVAADLPAAAIDYARELAAAGAAPRRLSAEPVARGGHDAAFFAEYRKSMLRETRGQFAPERIVRCVEAAVNLGFAEGCAVEGAMFDECLASPHSKALRHLFFAERECGKVPGIGKDVRRRPIARVGVVGAGTMGGGIAMCFVNAGIPVTLVETSAEALGRGLRTVRGNYEMSMQRGRMTAIDVDRRMELMRGTLDYAELAGVDLVVEAAFENMAVKQDVFRRLDAACKPGAILATNTSSLDVDRIAAATRRPQDVIGMHFFSPANVMTLLEVVRGRESADDVIATTMDIARTIGKIAVLSRVCFGFIGNRMFFPYTREAQRMLLEGVAPERIDRVAYDWGMAMGPHGVADLSGLDVFRKLYQEWEHKPADPGFCRVMMRLADEGRLGQKTRAGIFAYPDGRKATPDPAVAAIAREEAQRLGVAPHEASDDEIVERLFLAMINEGARILEEGVALRPGDIDVIYVNGYGFPRWRGGPMHHADRLGLPAVLDGILKYRARYGEESWTPAPLIERLARDGRGFADWRGS
ncbi:MAG: 3-hydroxyacyl-CoA dehydrogenase NAD-binding domain-containing protein [Gammaproteobacteria bacterium]